MKTIYKDNYNQNLEHLTFFLFFSFSLLLPQICLAKEIAITIDDAPRRDGRVFSGLERTQK